jgi:hypothetical protein
MKRSRISNGLAGVRIGRAVAAEGATAQERDERD